MEKLSCDFAQGACFLHRKGADYDFETDPEAGHAFEIFN